MFTQVLWWMENILLAYLLIRGIQRGLLWRYPFFYSYIGYVLAESLLRYVVYMAFPHFYRILYWNTQFLSIALSFFLVLEIYNAVLSQYPGAAKIARAGLLVLILAAAGRLVINQLFLPAWAIRDTAAMIERDLRMTQILSLAVIISALAYYKIPIGKNTRGLIVGFGIQLGTTVGVMAIHAILSKEAVLWWSNARPIFFLITLFVWSVSLSVYYPNPEPPKDSRLASHYEVVASLTSGAISQATRYLTRGVRP